MVCNSYRYYLQNLKVQPPQFLFEQMENLVSRPCQIYVKAIVEPHSCYEPPCHADDGYSFLCFGLAAVSRFCGNGGIDSLNHKPFEILTPLGAHGWLCRHDGYDVPVKILKSCAY